MVCCTCFRRITSVQVVVGMHSKWMSGIDFIKDGGQHTFHLYPSNVEKPMLSGPATCVVVSGGYADDVDGGEELIYTGQGGVELNSKKHVKDQKCINQSLKKPKKPTKK